MRPCSSGDSGSRVKTKPTSNNLIYLILYFQREMDTTCPGFGQISSESITSDYGSRETSNSEEDVISGFCNIHGIGELIVNAVFMYETY